MVAVQSLLFHSGTNSKIDINTDNNLLKSSNNACFVQISFISALAVGPGFVQRIVVVEILYFILQVEIQVH